MSSRAPRKSVTVSRSSCYCLLLYLPVKFVLAFLRHLKCSDLTMLIFAVCFRGCFRWTSAVSWFGMGGCIAWVGILQGLKECFHDLKQSREKKCEEYSVYASSPKCLFLHLLEVRRILMPTRLRLQPALLRRVAVPRQHGCSSWDGAWTSWTASTNRRSMTCRKPGTNLATNRHYSISLT